MKVVINATYGGFSVSREAAKFMAARGHKEAIEAVNRVDGPSGFDGHICMDDRSNVDLVAAVETLYAGAGGRWTILKVVEIPDDVEWELEEYDGLEWVAEKHRTWD